VTIALGMLWTDIMSCPHAKDASYTCCELREPDFSTYPQPLLQLLLDIERERINT